MRVERFSWTSIQVLVSDTRRWIQIGLIEAAKQAVIDGSEEVDES